MIVIEKVASTVCENHPLGGAVRSQQRYSKTHASPARPPVAHLAAAPAAWERLSVTVTVTVTVTITITITITKASQLPEVAPADRDELQDTNILVY